MRLHLILIPVAMFRFGCGWGSSSPSRIAQTSNQLKVSERAQANHLLPGLTVAPGWCCFMKTNQRDLLPAPADMPEATGMPLQALSEGCPARIAESCGTKNGRGSRGTPAPCSAVRDPNFRSHRQRGRPTRNTHT